MYIGCWISKGSKKKGRRKEERNVCVIIVDPVFLTWIITVVKRKKKCSELPVV